MINLIKKEIKDIQLTIRAYRESSPTIEEIRLLEQLFSERFFYSDGSVVSKKHISYDLLEFINTREIVTLSKAMISRNFIDLKVCIDQVKRKLDIQEKHLINYSFTHGADIQIKKVNKQLREVLSTASLVKNYISKPQDVIKKIQFDTLIGSIETNKITVVDKKFKCNQKRFIADMILCLDNHGLLIDFIEESPKQRFKILGEIFCKYFDCPLDAEDPFQTFYKIDTRKPYNSKNYTLIEKAILKTTKYQK